MEQQVNLYQPILGAEKRLFSARAIGTGLGVLAACLALLAGYASWRAARVERAIAALEQQQAARLAFEGAATDPRLVPAYLAALGEEHALDGARFDHLVMRRAKPEEAPALTVFELGAPGLTLPEPEKAK